VLGRIGVPTLLLNARNDPFLPAAALPRPDEVSAHVHCDFPVKAGNAAFVSGPFPGNLGMDAAPGDGVLRGSSPMNYPSGNLQGLRHPRASSANRSPAKA